MYDAGRGPQYDRFPQPGIDRHFSKSRIFLRLSSSFNIIACSRSSPGSGIWRGEREKLVQDLKGVNIQENNRGADKEPMQPAPIRHLRRAVSPALPRMIGLNHLKNKLFLTGFFPSNMIGTPSHVQIEPSDTFMA